ncbi:MAG: hypothetical protein N2745_04345 [Syntrophorhabdaceae bacterium]|nr:hypothetical protein [Syntrophorhabdaceae bacterium]
MKGFKICMLVYLVLFALCGPSISDSGEKGKETQVSGSASLGTYNRYIFRGYEIGRSGLVIQPSVNLSLSGFSLSIWGNLDTNQRNTKTATFANEFKKGWNETDLIMSYTYEIKKLSLSGGYIYYGTRYADETEELYLSASYGTLFNPTITIYRDITNYKGTYMNFNLSHSFPIYKDITIDVGGSAGYFIGESDYWRTYDSTTATYTGKKYRGFHDGMVKAGFTIPINKNISIQPTIQYWFPLSSDAEREYPTVGDIKDSYNPNGPVKYNLVYGVGFVYKF